MGYLFGGIQHSPVNDCLAASCNFGVLTGEDEHTSFYSVINRAFFVCLFLYLFSLTVGLHWSLEFGLCLCFDQRNLIEVISELWGLATRSFDTSVFNCWESCFALQFEEAHIATDYRKKAMCRRSEVTKLKTSTMYQTGVRPSWTADHLDKCNHMIEAWESSAGAIQPTQNQEEERIRSLLY